MPGLSEFLKSSAERLPAGPGSQLLGREETEPSWRGCRVRDGAALPGRWWPRRGDRRESPPPTRGCSSFRGRARQPPAPPRGRWGHYHSLGLPSTHAGLLAPDWHQRASRGFSWGLEGMTYMYLCVPRGAPGTRCVLCSLQLTLPFFRVFFCFLAVPADCDKKSWQNRAEPLSHRETQQCVSAGCGWEIKLGAGEAGDGAAVSPIRGFVRAAEFSGVSVFSRRSVEDVEITLLGVQPVCASVRGAASVRKWQRRNWAGYDLPGCGLCCALLPEQPRA